MASLVTKRYKKEAFYEFLQARKKTWRQLFAVLILGALLSYPTPILNKLKELDEIKYYPEKRKQMNEAILTLFYVGVYTEHTSLLMVGLLLLGLAIERIAINWLENRFGCTHFKF